MTKSLRTIAPLLLAAFALPGLAVAAPGSDTTKVDLLSAVRAVSPGHPFYVGIRFRLRKGWHTYWKNPGDSGLPPRISWKLPPGFQAGPIEWPAPERFLVSDLMTYGYHDELILPVQITPPERIEGTSARIEGTVDWLECQEACVPGTAPVMLTLAVSSNGDSRGAGAASIDAARARVPGPAAGWTMKAEAGPRAISLAFDPPRGVSPPRVAYLYVEQPLVVEHAPPQGLERSGAGYRLTATPALNAVRNPERLTGVLLLEGGGLFGRRTAVQVDVPVFQGNPAPAPAQKPAAESTRAGLVAAAVALAVGVSLFLSRKKRREPQVT
jgi:DsbC/DsbD-like thiol-disulfide interchange protein